MPRAPIAKGLFTWPSDEPRLIGSRCTACGVVTFPTQDSCPRCASTAMAEHLRQLHEVVLQLRGQAGDRQVPGKPRVGYTQLYGAPGTAGVSILSL